MIKQTPETKKVDLNTLCYQVLGVLMRSECSGYEIAKQLESIRPVKTSQIYPTLARMEKLELVVSQDVEQESRPNKRVYSVTSKGSVTLKSWVGTEPAPPVLRDDFLTMIYSAWTKEPDQVIAMFQRRLTYLADTMEMLQSLLAVHRTTYPDEIKNPRNWHFFRDVLLSRRLFSYEQEAIWSRGVMHKLQEFIDNECEPGQLPDL